jgi:hypothetical protein
MPRNNKQTFDSLIRFRAGKDLQVRLEKIAKKRRCSVSQVVRDIAYSATEPQTAN